MADGYGYGYGYGCGRDYDHHHDPVEILRDGDECWLLQTPDAIENSPIN